MNKQLSVMGLAARASMVPVLIASGLTALAVGALTYLANPENTGGAAGVGAATLAAAVGYLMVMVMLGLGGCGFGSQTAYTVRRLRLREELVDLWRAAYHAAILLVLWALPVMMGRSKAHTQILQHLFRALPTCPRMESSTQTTA